MIAPPSTINSPISPRMASLAEGEAGCISICILFGRLAVHNLPALLELRLAVLLLLCVCV